jgi:protein TonB
MREHNRFLQCLKELSEDTMFDQTFVETTDGTAKPVTVALSVLLQAGAIAVLILIPLLYTTALPSASLKDLLIAPAPPRAAVPAKEYRAAVQKGAPRTFQVAHLYAPTKIPRTVTPSDMIAAAPDIGVPGATSDAGSAIDFGGVIGSVPEPPPPMEKPPPTRKPNSPLRIGSGLEEANLVHRVMPVYPPLAKATRVQGAVEFTALISKDGRIENLQLLRGHPLLVNAARAAVEQWRYRPTLLNGEPVEVITDIIVNFTLTQ